ncbi:MAG: T9SS type A sorting domain-containing protein, partial [Rhodothermales bacterium]|nr:T9SS type A sorting domain-containing protein [Rhodothermales bacterium]
GRAASGWSNERIASAGALQSLVKAVRLDSNRVRFEVDVPFATDDLRLLDLKAYAVPPSGTAPISARTVVSATQVRGFLATFDRAIPDGYTVRLTGTNALPLGPIATAPSSTLFVVRADVLDRSRVRMVFSAPLDPSSIRAAGFRVEPSGTVAGAALDPSNASAVIVTLSGAVVGATGLSTAIVADGLRTPSGATLDPDGRAVRLTSAAADLSEAYVFPNPVRPSEAPDGAMIAGLPAEADVTVLSVEGQRLRTLEERDGDGGTRWDLRDDAGRDVPSGVYLVRIATTDGKATFVRVAVIR